MKVSELKLTDIKVGLRIKGLKTVGLQGTVIEINRLDDNLALIKWDNEDRPYSSGFYGNDCECEVVTDNNGNIIYFDV